MNLFLRGRKIVLLNFAKAMEKPLRGAKRQSNLKAKKTFQAFA